MHRIAKEDAEYLLERSRMKGNSEKNLLELEVAFKVGALRAAPYSPREWIDLTKEEFLLFGFEDVIMSPH